MAHMATTLILLAVTISLLLTAHTFINQFKLIRPVPKSISHRVAILIPARNEELDIETAVQSALSQQLLESFIVIALDDDSTDATFAKLTAFTDSNLKVISGDPNLPDGWLGKNWACHQLALSVEADYLVFIDSDVVLEPLAVAGAISAMSEHALDLVSPYPKQLAYSALAKLVQPLLQWSWLTTVPLGMARRTSRSSLAVANGQFLACTSESYFASGGHEGIKREVLDDIELLRAFYQKGFKGCVIDGSALATCQMYRTDKQLITGYSKSLWHAFGGFAGSIAVNLLFIFVYVFPLTGFITGEPWVALTGYLAGATGRVITAKASRGPVFPAAFLHPISILVFLWLNSVSWYRHLRKINTWKSRDLK
jgi:glycosyltransferase involved in cell wall biosynthesis